MKEMTEGIMIAIITGCLAAIPTIIAVVVNNAKTIYRIDVLEKKVEKHNNLVERVFRLEDNDQLFEEKLNTQGARITKLESNA